MLETIFMVIGILFAILGIILVIVGIRQRSDMKECSEVSARIVDVEVRTYRRSYQVHTCYIPTYEYTFLGETKRYAGSSSMNDITGSVGTEVTLYVSKSGKIYEKGAAAVMLIVGVVFAVFGVFFAALGIVL